MSDSATNPPPAASAAAGTAPSKKSLKKEEKKAKKEAKDALPASAVKVFLHPEQTIENTKLALAAAYLKIEAAGVKDSKEVDAQALALPALKDGDRVVFTTVASLLYLLYKAGQPADASLTNALLAVDVITRALFLAQSDASPENVADLAKLLQTYEDSKPFDAQPFLGVVMYPVMYKALPIVCGVTQLTDPQMTSRFPYVVQQTLVVHKSAYFPLVQPLLNGKVIHSSQSAVPQAPASSSSAAASAAVEEAVVRAVLPRTVDWQSEGLVSSLKLLFDCAIRSAFPALCGGDANTHNANVVRCANPQFGDFQCNNALALGKALKSLEGYTGKTAPRDVAERICLSLPENPLVASATPAPNGFINIKLSTQTLLSHMSALAQHGPRPPALTHSQNVLVDFSSPNIAKEMHVGHLRSTIIGDCISRLFEFSGCTVHRCNHVGDWGTQFGMLITYLLQEYPDILTNPPNISDLTAIYKESKKRFDADEKFKETSRLNVVSLQSGDETCTKIWKLLCDISRKEFQKVYDMLRVTLEEKGESYYNDMIPAVLEELMQKGLCVAEPSENETGQALLTIKLPHFTIPLIVRKSDGGYGYDSTDMAALHYRLFTLLCDRVVIITDAGQAPHFHMCFDAGKAAGWLEESAKVRAEKTGKPAEPARLDHIGFGVVCGDDGKRFKTRSSETVRLIDLLDAAKDRMKSALLSRPGASSWTEEELEETCARIGYGAVKYFDLKQHPGTDYIFNYDRMLDTKGDTAVYLMFAYARLLSILKKAKDEKAIDTAAFVAQAEEILSVEHVAERALAFELLQFSDVVQSVLQDLLPNRLCDYLKEVSVRFTEFVTKCHVLNAEDERTVRSRLLLCEATRLVMYKCFELLGIEPVERI